MATSIGLSGRQRFVLRVVVGLVPGLTTDRLSAMLGVDRSVLEVEVTHLVANGLLATKVSAVG